MEVAAAAAAAAAVAAAAAAAIALVHLKKYSSGDKYSQAIELRCWRKTIETRNRGGGRSENFWVHTFIFYTLQFIRLWIMFWA